MNPVNSRNGSVTMTLTSLYKHGPWYYHRYYYYCRYAVLNWGSVRNDGDDDDDDDGEQ